MQWHPHVTVATLVEQDNRFLLVHERDELREVYNQPAGHWERNETLQQAAIRETLEETGWQVELTDVLGLYVYHAVAIDITYLRIAFIARPIAQVSTQLDAGIIAPLWLTYDDVIAQHEMLRSPLVLQCIDDYRRGQRFPLSMIFQPTI